VPGGSLCMGISLQHSVGSVKERMISGARNNLNSSSPVGRTPTCDRQTDGHVTTAHTALAQRRRAVNGAHTYNLGGWSLSAT